MRSPPRRGSPGSDHSKPLPPRRSGALAPSAGLRSTSAPATRAAPRCPSSRSSRPPATRRSRSSGSSCSRTSRTTGACAPARCCRSTPAGAFAAGWRPRPTAARPRSTTCESAPRRSRVRDEERVLVPGHRARGPARARRVAAQLRRAPERRAEPPALRPGGAQRGAGGAGGARPRRARSPARRVDGRDRAGQPATAARPAAGGARGDERAARRRGAPWSWTWRRSWRRRVLRGPSGSPSPRA